MTNKNAHPRIIISGGGTGGHVFPALAIAEALQKQAPSAEVLFVGAEGKMEMEKVPQAGYKIEGLPVRGFPRKMSLQAFRSVFLLWKSLRKAKKIIKGFGPDAVIGVGGYASGPVGRVAARRGILLVLQEQNSYAGITNRLLAKHARKIFVAYDAMDKFFPAEKIIKSGNPLRGAILKTDVDIDKARLHFGLKPVHKKVVLMTGGSGGARQMNESVIRNIGLVRENSNIAFLWQTGKYYYAKAQAQLEGEKPDNLFVMDFISRMDYAFAVADLVVARAGAGTISELGVVGKPALFVPSPNVAGDHQKKNAMALAEKQAAELVEDKDAPEKLIRKAISLVRNEERCAEMSGNIRQFGMPDAADRIAGEILSIIS